MLPVRDQNGLHLTEPDLWLDPHRPKPFAFVSHAHADHFARHERCLCSEATATLLRARYRVAESRIQAVPFHSPIEHAGHRLLLLPAGHIRGSAMLHITRLADGKSLLYTGDFKTRHGRTAEPAAFRHADTLILETTFALPKYVFPPPLEVEAAVLRFVHGCLDGGEIPILLGYSLGKAQEALALLHEHGIPAVLHAKVAEMTQACRDSGLTNLPEPILLEKTVPPGHAVIAPPNAVRSTVLRRLKNARTAMLSGWAMTPGAAYRYRVDEAIPLSDHADHPGLMECIQRVQPKRVLTVHGYCREFAAELRQRGLDAWSASGKDQLELTLPTARAQKISPVIKRPNCGLADFTDLLRLVGETHSRLGKIDHLSRYLAALEPDLLPLAANWLSGRPLSRGDGVLHTGTAALRRALLSLPKAREERYRDISVSQNDAARTARLFLQEIPLTPEPIELAGAHDFFRELAAAPGSLAKIELLAHRFRHLNPAESETLVRILTGDLRIGLKEGLLEEALAAAFGADPAELRHAHMLTGDLGETAILARDQKLATASLRPFVPVKVMLASPETAAQAIYDRHGSSSLWLEPKYDGIRAQLHKKGTQAALFSRDLKPIDAQFPELLEAARQLPGDFILDGEIIAHAEGRRLTFNDLQKRLGRLATAQSDLFADTPASLPPVAFIAFDILLGPAGTLLEHPLTDRRAALEALLQSTIINRQSAITPIEVMRTDSVDGIESAFKSSLLQHHEGLISKDPTSSYSPGRRGKAWLKLKGVMPTLDCVVVAAEQGHGKRAEWLSDYTFAVRDETNGALRIIGKAYSGVSDAEIEELTDHFQRHTLEKQRRKHLVEPNLVLEIAFDSIRPSKRHDSGLALRFPRIKGIRRDKSPQEIDTLQHARSLL
ncbi:ATP-dependent DNA ligase [Haloferula sargassicola]|uniref:DNA ligase n=1 Tax=Haloferula sargassicola TaxID=490096 RepID=A0ABP9ULC3_9BACT